MSSYRLHYFNARGRAEVSRLIFAAVGQKFEDIRYERHEWPSHQNRMPLGQMPVLEYEGVKLPQSLSIARFLAKQFHLAGRDNFEQAKVDAIVDTVSDFAPKLIALAVEKDESKKQAMIRKLFTEEMPEYLQSLEFLGKLYGNGGPYFVGNHLTWADLYFYDTAENLLRIDATILNRFPWLIFNRQEIEKHPNISAYLKSRPQTFF